MIMSSLKMTTPEKEDFELGKKNSGIFEQPVQTVLPIDKKVWSKLDRHILPIVAMLYLLSFLVSAWSQAQVLL